MLVLNRAASRLGGWLVRLAPLIRSGPVIRPAAQSPDRGTDL